MRAKIIIKGVCKLWVATAVILSLTMGMVGTSENVTAVSLVRPSGICGTDTQYNIDGTTLTISGTGAVDKIYLCDESEYDESYEYTYEHRIERIVVEDGITELSPELFYEYDHVTEIVLPDTLKIIGNGAFGNCRRLKSLTIPASVEKADSIFYENTDLKKVINNSKTDIDINWHMSGLLWDIDGKADTIVATGQTAVSTPRVFGISYVLNGGKINGKKVTEFPYSMTPTALPKAYKKNYSFAGWVCDEPGFPQKHRILDNSIYGLYGDRTLKADYIRFKLAKGKKKIIIKYKSADGKKRDLYMKYSTSENLKKSKTIYWDGDDVSSGKGIKAAQKSGWYTLSISKLKKKKKYYVQLGIVERGEEKADIYPHTVYHPTIYTKSIKTK